MSADPPVPAGQQPDAERPADPPADRLSEAERPADQPADPSGTDPQPADPQPVDPQPVDFRADDSRADGARKGGWLVRNRRAVLREAAVGALGLGAGIAGFAEVADVAERKLPLWSGPAAATTATRRTHPGRSRLTVNWAVDTDQRRLALTFDDGPSPNWTPKVLDILEQYAVPATFFMVGQRVVANRRLVDGRMARHEAGNHSWDHHDLARLGADRVRDQLRRAHDAIGAAVGRAPVLLRPPYGHFGGSTALVASEFGYSLVLWSQQMRESDFPNNPAGHAEEIASAVVPGTILLAHDVGPEDRLIAIDGLPILIERLRSRGYTFVTVSELLAGSDGAKA